MSKLAVLDTSTLQSLWRGGVLELLPTLYDPIVVPLSVADESAWSRALYGPKLVPDLKALSGFEVVIVGDAALRSAMDALFRAHFLRIRHRPFPPAATPTIARFRGAFLAWDKPRNLFKIRVPDLEVVVLAKEREGVAVIDDRKAIRAASDLGVTVLTTIDVVAELAERNLIASASAILDRIVASGYHPTRRASSTKTNR